MIQKARNSRIYSQTFLLSLAIISGYPISTTWAKPSPQASVVADPEKKSSSLPRFHSEKVSVAESKKTKSPIREGLIIGGDRAINQVIVKDIRFSSQKGFERIVIDLEGTHNGEKAAIPRPPYFQVEVNPDQKRIGVSLWGSPEIRVDSQKVASLFRKSSLLQSFTLLPKIEDEVWTFALPLKVDTQVEVFELTEPVRIIMDISQKRS